MRNTNSHPASYAGFTIGPIYDVISHAKKTRELWFGSYFFSWYMEELTNRLNEEENRFLTPFIEPPDKDAPPVPSATGKFHDRFVLQSSLPVEELYQQVKTANKKTLMEFSHRLETLRQNELSKFRGEKIDGADDVHTILKGYLQTRFLVLPPSEINGDNPVKKIDEILNSLEEHLIFTPGKSRRTCGRCKTLPGVVVSEVMENDQKNKMALCPLCLAKYRSNRLDGIIGLGARMPPERIERYRLMYPSVQEIAAAEILEDAEIRNQIKPDSDDEISFEQIEKVLKQLKRGPLKSVYKYMAIVQADGDNLGRLAKSIESPQELSERLFEFAGKAEDLITKEYGGLPVFIGGDDVLAFMPVCYKGKSVIDFVSEIFDFYKKIVDRGLNKTGLSLGINIAYHKFPLSTAMNQAGGLLFGDAKKTKGKGAAAICLTRHSGSELRFKLKIGDKSFELFQKLLNAGLNDYLGQNEANEETGQVQKSGTDFLPGGLFYNLGRFGRYTQDKKGKSQSSLLSNLPDKDRLHAFFENNFNEGGHDRFKEGLQQVEDLIGHYLFGMEKPSSGQERLELALNLIKFIKFLKGEENR